MELWNIIRHTGLGTINSAIEKGYFNRDLNTALISVFHKLGKDPQICLSYPLTSLINAGIKVYSKVIAMCLDKVTRKLINLDQTVSLKDGWHQITSTGFCILSLKPKRQAYPVDF